MAKSAVPKRSAPRDGRKRTDVAKKPAKGGWPTAWRSACAAVARRGATRFGPKVADLDRAVHLFRTDMKELRALVALGPPGLRDPVKATRRLAGDLRRSFGEARDAAVALATLRDLAVPAGAALQEHLARDAARAVGEPLVEPRTRAGILLARVAEEIGAWPLAGLDDHVVIDGVAAAYKRGRAAARDVRTAPIETIHDLRTAVVDLQYQMALLTPLWPGPLGAYTAEIKRLRGRLGRLVDLDNLGAVIARVEADSGLAADGALITKLRATARATRRASASLAERIFAEKTAAFSARLWRYR